MDSGKRTLSILQGFQRLGLIREALKPYAWFSRSKSTEVRAEFLAFSQAKTARELVEVRKAEVYAAAQRMLSAPR